MARYIGKQSSGSGTFISGSHSHGDIIYAGSGNFVHALISNTGTQLKFLSQSSGGLPAWAEVTKDTLGLGSVENTALSTWTGNTYLRIAFSQVSGIVPLAQGGLGQAADSGISSGYVFIGPTATGTTGSASFRAIAASDLPLATVSAPGVVQVGSGLTITGGILRADIDLSNAAGYTQPNKVLIGPTGGSAALPTFRALVGADLPLASTTVRGSIIVGSGLSISSGILRADIDLSSAAGQVGGNLVLAGPSSSGSSALPTFRALSSSDMPIATASARGAIIVGSGLSITSGGVLRADVDLSSAAGSTSPNFALLGPASGSAALPSFRALVASDIPSLDASKITTGTLSTSRLPLATTGTVGAIQVGYGLSVTDSGVLAVSAEAGLGSVVSVDLTVPTFLVVTGNPVTTSGTLAVSLSTQSAKTVFMGPTGGSAAAPTFRTLVGSDLPTASTTGIGAVMVGSGLSITSGILRADVDLSAAAGSVSSNYVLVGPSGIGTSGLPSFRALTGNDLPVASATSRGGIKVGDGLTITSGILSVTPVIFGGLTSVALTLPTGVFSVSGSPAYGDAADISASFVSQSANRVWAGPSSGSNASPTFRALVAADIPNIDASKVTSGTLASARLPYATTSGIGAIQVGSGLSITTGGLLSVDNNLPGLGTVTSVDLSVPTGVFSVSGSPITDSGTLAISLASQASKAVLIGPASTSGVPTFRSLVEGDLPSLSASKVTTGTFAPERLPVSSYTSLGAVRIASGGALSIDASGTLSADLLYALPTYTEYVGLTMPTDIFNVSGSPVTSSGTFAVTLDSQAINTVWAGPSSGSSTTPSFRTLVSADIPNLNASKITTGTLSASRLPTATSSGLGVVQVGAGLSITTGGVISSSATGTVTSVTITVPSFLAVPSGTVTSSGTIAIYTADQPAATVFAGPVSGNDAAPTFRPLAASDIPTLSASQVSGGTLSASSLPAATTGSLGAIIVGSGLSISSGVLSVTGTSSSGSVTSVGLSLPDVFTVTGSPVTDSGTLTASFTTQAANLVFSGPSSGSSASPSFRALTESDLPNLPASKITSGTFSAGRLPVASTTGLGIIQIGSGLSIDVSGVVSVNVSGAISGLSEQGTVTSVGLSVPSLFQVANSPVTSSGTLAVTLSMQSANMVLAGPASGSSATPSFRSLSDSDIPTLSAAKIGSGTLSASVLPAATASTLGAIIVGSGLSISAGVLSASGSSGAGTVTSIGLVLPDIFSVTSSPVTSSGTISSTLTNQSANLFFAGPTGGAATAPTFRAITQGDLPGLTASIITGGTLSGTLLPEASATTLGAIKVGSGLTITSGVLSATGGGGAGGSGMTNPMTTIGDVIYASDTGSPATPARLGLVAGGMMYGGASAPAWTAAADLTWDNTNKRLGIGKAVPSTVLDIVHTIAGNAVINFANSSADPSASTRLILNNSATSAGLQLRSAGHATEASDIVLYSTNNNIRFYAGGNARVSILSGGNVGIGTTSPSYPFHVASTLTATTSTSLSYANATITPSGASSAGYFGQYSLIRDTGGNLTGTLTAVYGEAYHGGSSTLAWLRGVSAALGTNGSGNITSAAAFYAFSPVQLSSGAYTTAYAAYLGAQKVSGVTTGYGLYSAGATDYNYFAGQVGIGVTSPSSLLHLASGTSSVAPLQFTSGASLASPAAGAVEFNGANLFVTNSSLVRKTVAFTDSTMIGVWNGTPVGAAYGGTGYSTYTDGQLLIGNSSNNSLSKATLTAGTGITITNGNGAITISTTAASSANGQITFTPYQMNLTSTTVAARIDDVNNMSNRVYTIENIGYYPIYIGSDSTVSVTTGFKLEPGDIFETVLTSNGALWGVTEFGTVRLSVLRGQ